MVKTLKRRCETMIEVKKSKFYAIALPTSSYENIKENVNLIRQEHPDATHVVHCAVLGKNRDIFSYSDDREPKNTAGRPAFEVLKGSDVTNITVCIVRYFGGTLLGTGGLVKAYSDSVKAVLPLLECEDLIDKTTFKIEFTYDYFTPIKRLFDEYSTVIEDEQFGVAVALTCTLPTVNFEALKDKLIQLTNATIRFL